MTPKLELKVLRPSTTDFNNTKIHRSEQILWEFLYYRSETRNTRLGITRRGIGSTELEPHSVKQLQSHTAAVISYLGTSGLPQYRFFFLVLVRNSGVTNYKPVFFLERVENLLTIVSVENLF